ncbi:hypothetical protein [Candidatus Oscillochloris fontis]|uniref:hypothetical protein n=1 Tax=Candidatus Oscillochloris fontis TaxID=2496868 RepID=UPI001EE7A9FA|nr:hypothetical protein [Candidatus Oscillochloris fontis]
MQMQRAYSALLTLAALGFVLWLIWSRLRIVVWVSMPWWGLLLVGLILFVSIDFLIHRVLGGKK